MKRANQRLMAENKEAGLRREIEQLRSEGREQAMRLEAALKEAGVMGGTEDLGVLRGVVLRHLTADASGGGVVNGDDLSWDYADAPHPTRPHPDPHARPDPRFAGTSSGKGATTL